MRIFVVAAFVVAIPSAAFCAAQSCGFSLEDGFRNPPGFSDLYRWRFGINENEYDNIKMGCGLHGRRN